MWRLRNKPAFGVVMPTKGGIPAPETEKNRDSDETVTPTKEVSRLKNDKKPGFLLRRKDDKRF